MSKRYLIGLILLFILNFAVVGEAATTSNQATLERAWKQAEKAAIDGPKEVSLGDQAKLNLPDKYIFIPKNEANNIMKAMGNGDSKDLLGMVVSKNSDDNWYIVIEFRPEGYIKDDDAKSWNIDDLFKELKEGTEELNKERTKKGFKEMEIIGWVEKPQYDQAKRQLIWSISSRDKGDTSDDNTINYNTYVLGREGYIDMCLVTDLKEIERDKPAALDLLKAIEYVPGKRYEDFNSSTDKIAEYGLAALVGGVAAKKLGILAIVGAFCLKFIKVIIVAVVALGAGIAKFFRRKKDNTEDVAEKVDEPETKTESKDS
ncbi:MAG: Protein of unknown function rane [Firmicutes bacterium]|nr:Protein of unknown function rane [Bacillota bacterium]